MTDHTPELSRGDEYIVFYSGGPYDGRSDPRISTDGTWESELTVIAAFDGQETALEYVAPVARQVGDQVHVTYTWDPKDSDAVETLEDRGEL
jgi:hypothetical protein